MSKFVDFLLRSSYFFFSKNNKTLLERNNVWWLRFVRAHSKGQRKKQASEIGKEFL